MEIIGQPAAAVSMSHRHGAVMSITAVYRSVKYGSSAVIFTPHVIQFTPSNRCLPQYSIYMYTYLK